MTIRWWTIFNTLSIVAFLAITVSSPCMENKLSSNELRMCYDTLQDREEQFKNLVLEAGLEIA